MAQFVYFAALVVCCTTGKSLGTTSPQQQNTGATKDLCEKAILAHGFPGNPGSNGVPGIPGVPGLQGPQGRDGAKEETGDKGSQGMLGPKGEKGESVTSPSCAVPQTNWKQCVWKNINDDQNNGKIKDCSFNKLQSDTAIKVSFQGNMAFRGSSSIKCNRWFFKFNGNECSGPMTIEAVVYNWWRSVNPEAFHHRSFEGYCENIPQGTVRVELWVGRCHSRDSLGDAYTGWNSVSRIIIEEVSRPQS